MSPLRMKPPVNPLRSMTARDGQKPSKRRALAQHFLVDKSVLSRILSASELSDGDTVVEVGAGNGALTRELVRTAAKVIAVEIDPELASSLPVRLHNPSNLRVINDDARHMDLASMVRENESYKMVGNLPYYAATPILRHFLESDGLRPSTMVVMVQREVADRMVAHNGRMSLLAVSVQLYGVPRVICTIPPGAFSPAPKVTSALVRIDPLPRPAIDVSNVRHFFDLVRAGFSAPRKQLRNSLSLGLAISPSEAESLLAQAGVNPRLRPENLSLEHWKTLYECAGALLDPGALLDHGDQSIRQD